MKSISTERYVNDQLGRASYSVVLNIAEGSAKLTKPDRRNFFTISRASVFECVAILDILRTEEKLNEREYSISLKMADEISRILFAMIKNLSA
jgi:four helix bundle protein